ncbi:MAG: Mce-associated rane protein, partial [Micromonosporaceae bacterium]
MRTRTARRLTSVTAPLRPSRRRATLVALAAAAVLAGTVAGLAWYTADRAGQRDSAGRACMTAATAAAQAIFSYDYRSFDAGVTAAKPYTTGDFAKEYARTTSSLKPTAVKEQAVVQAQVSAVGVVQAGTGQVELLVYLNQYRRNANISGEKVDQNRVVLTMIRIG